MKKLLSLFLTIIILFGCVACSEEKAQKQTAPTADQTLTDEYILKGGLTDYKIVMPDTVGEYEQIACDELVLLFKEATGQTLEVASDNTFNEDEKYFSIGQTRLLESANISVSEDAKGKGAFQITTKGKTIFFIGGRKNGVLFAVYEFLFRTLNFEQFSYDCYSLDKGVTEIPLYKYNVVDGPDFYNFQAFTGYMTRNRGVSLRMKATNLYGELAGKINGKDGHNTLDYISPDKYNNQTVYPELYHPEWFASGGIEQLCYMAQGNEESRELLVKTYAENMIVCIKEQPEAEIWFGVSGMDNHQSCACDTCKDLLKKYGCNSAQGIWFVNDLYDEIMKWFATEEGQKYYNPDFKMAISFYEAYQEAPARLNKATGKWEPIDETVVLKEGILASSAPAYASYQVPLTHPENEFYYNNIMAIDACSYEMRFWIYATNFVGYYLYPFDNFSSMQQNYQFMYNLGARAMLDETQNGNYQGMTGFHMLKSYLSNQLAWDIYADQNELIDRFFKGYFLDAADDMLKYFNSYLNFSKLQMNGLCPGIGAFTYNIGKKEYWPKSVIDTWQGYVEDALEKIEKYKTIDPQTYEMLYKHITMERVFLDYVSILFYKQQLGMQYDLVRDRFVEGIRINAIEQTRSGTYIEDFISTLYEN